MRLNQTQLTGVVSPADYDHEIARRMWCAVVDEDEDEDEETEEIRAVDSRTTTRERAVRS
jgi:hypothetical protein